MWKKTYKTNSPAETKKLGQRLAKEILKTRAEQAVVLALKGDLGSGKTTFLQGFAKGLGIKEKITSPTFVILKRFNDFYHFDCYRINEPEEILELGFKKIIANPENIIAIEWPERIKEILPKNIIKIKFEFISPVARKIKLLTDGFINV